ncbi:hypothetical protein Ccrd_014968 [Cynara cardunculus var. scolymus]|uniref:Uncharacterized protein n=1 Tax=Cynara cardunculus var. scolymus TaxID=59895 RepID=A0A118K3Z9_CYNCS|nr:hypothetical protein Ccrd_014968 [Cynara cardunculus var. scolymus]
MESWTPIIEKFKYRLSLWKARSISFRGRLTLIKLVLGSLALYFFSLFRAWPGSCKFLRVLGDIFLGGVGGCEETGLGGIGEGPDFVAKRGVSWSSSWLRDLRGRALSDLQEFKGLIHNLHPTLNAKDKWFWLLDANAVFSVRGLQELIN